MSEDKKEKKIKPDKHHTPETRTLIKKLLKEEKTKGQIAAQLGFSSKTTKYIIDRWGLEENLLKPVLIGVR